MTLTTANLNLVKIDTSLNADGTVKDGNLDLNLDTFLNENWDKVDTAVGTLQTNNHTHSNKSILDKIISSGDGSSFLANDGTYKALSAQMLINPLGSTSSTAITLEVNKITTAAFTSTPTITLPTISDGTKEATCILDFTTTNASYPLISTTGTLRWSDTNGGTAPPFYITISPIRNRFIFKTVDAGVNWEVTYNYFGGVEKPWTQQALTANGTLGGGSLACASDSGNAYSAFNQDGTSTYWLGSTANVGYLTLYTPTPVKASVLTVTNVSIAYSDYYVPTAGTLYGSNDGTTWTSLTTYTNSNTTGQWTITIPTANRNFYKYYKFNVVTTGHGNPPAVSELLYTGTYISS